MKKVLMVLSISLFLFSCGETNKSEKTESSGVNDSQNVEKQIVGKWILKLYLGKDAESENKTYIMINEDNTYKSVNYDITIDKGTWSINGDEFCEKITSSRINDEGGEECSKYQLDGNKLTITRLLYSSPLVSVYEKQD